MPLNISDAEMMLAHGRHCIEYLRQSVKCSPDLTLEPIEIGGQGLKTWGVARQCMSFRSLAEWAVDKRASDNSGIERQPIAYYQDVAEDLTLNHMTAATLCSQECIKVKMNKKLDKVEDYDSGAWFRRIYGVVIP